MDFLGFFGLRSQNIMVNIILLPVPPVENIIGPPRGDKSEGIFGIFLKIFGCFLDFVLPYFLEKSRPGGPNPGENDF